MTAFSSLYGTRLDEELHADSTVLFTTARRKAAINRGVAEFADLTECLERTAVIASTVAASNGPLSMAVSEFDLNSTLVIAAGDCQRLAKTGVQWIYTDASSQVTIIAGEDLPQRSVEWLNRYEPGWQDSTQASSVMQLPEAYYERVDGARIISASGPRRPRDRAPARKS
jgi:hypothetical protein